HRPMVCGLYLALDAAPDLAALRDRVAEAAAAHPRLAQRLDGSRRAPVWRDAGGAPALETLALPDLDDHAAFVAHAAARMPERLDEGAPLWTLRAVRTAGGHGLWLRWHHTLSDGEGMLDLVGALCDGAPADRLALAPAF